MSKSVLKEKSPPVEPGTKIKGKLLDRLNNQVPTGEALDGSAPLLHGQDIGVANAYELEFVFGVQSSSGTNDAVAANRLKDTAATFITDGIDDDPENAFEVLNITDLTSAKVTEVYAEGELVLDDDIFLSTGKKYAIGRHLSQLPQTLTEGARFSFKATNANTGPSTLDINGIGAKGIKRIGGGALEAGDIQATRLVEVVYDGADFILINSGSIQTKIIDIGDWNMDTTGNIDVNHGLTLDKIKSVEILIRTDSGIGNTYPIDYPFSGVVAGYWHINAVQVKITRVAGAFFDSVQFDSTSYNRGWVTITYVA